MAGRLGKYQMVGFDSWKGQCKALLKSREYGKPHCHLITLV